MRSINVSTDVFARIWANRAPGEETEDAILRRILSQNSLPEPARSIASLSLGLRDRRHNVDFPEGFEIFRRYHGKEHQARAQAGHWLLVTDGKSYGSLNELSQAIGAKVENAWVNWFYLDSHGQRRSVSDLRDPSTIGRRKAQNGDSRGNDDMSEEGYKDMNIEGATWRDDVRDALQHLGRRASLHRIYNEVRAVRRAGGRSLPTSFEAVVRKTLEENSSDSEAFRGGADLFCMPEGRGAGVWALRG